MPRLRHGRKLDEVSSGKRSPCNLPSRYETAATVDNTQKASKYLINLLKDERGPQGNFIITFKPIVKDQISASEDILYYL